MADTASADAYGIAADELRQFVERYEHLEAEKKDIAEQMKEVMAEAKGRGYDTKALRKIIALRKRDKNDLAEEEAVLELYKTALGMGWDVRHGGGAAARRVPLERRARALMLRAAGQRGAGWPETASCSRTCPTPGRRARSRRAG